MAGHRPWREISAKNRTDPARNARVTAGVREMLLIADLTALREARALTQSALATEIGVSQARISQIEHQGDLTISTLEEYVRGLGGELRISAVFPDGTVELVGKPRGSPSDQCESQSHGRNGSMNHKRRRPKNRRAGCLMCKPCKINGFRTERPDGERFSDHKRREFARREAAVP